MSNISVVKCKTPDRYLELSEHKTGEPFCLICSDGIYVKHHSNGLDHHRVYRVDKCEWITLANEVHVIPVSLTIAARPLPGYSF
jgi:hypothetical protein